MPANRKNPGVHDTARQSRDREGALANFVPGMRSLTVAARIGASRPSTFMSRTQPVPGPAPRSMVWGTLVPMGTPSGNLGAGA